MADADAVLTTIRTFVEQCNKDAVVEPEMTLYAEGIGLDSLETAELSAILEADFGTDPFSEGDVPETVGDIIAFYAKVTSST